MSTPNGWKKMKFGGFAKRINDMVPNREEWTFDRYISGTHFDSGEIRIKNSAPIEGNEEVIGYQFQWRFKPGDLLYVVKNPRLRKAGVVDFEGLCSISSFVIRSDKEIFLQKLLPFLFQTEDFTFHLCNNAHGSTNPFLNWKDIAKYEVLIPPIKEQEKISEALWSIENNIKANEELLKQHIQYKSAFLHETFSKIKTHVKMSAVTENLDGKRVPVSASDRSSGKYPYYGATGIVDYVDDYIFDDELLLVGEDGADWSANANTSFIATGKFWVNNHAHVLKCTKIDINYLKEFLNRTNLNSYVVGTTRGKLTKKELMSILIPLPKEDVQKDIVKKIHKINEVLSDIQKNLYNLKSLRNKFSNELLTGKLRLEDSK
jgi:type I restriction enzyme, S subunit